MTDVEKSEILNIWYVCDEENVAIHAKFMIFSCKNQFCQNLPTLSRNPFVAIYTLLCGEKFIQKFSSWRKNDKYEVWVWKGMVWSDWVWYGKIWYGLIWCGMV